MPLPLASGLPPLSGRMGERIGDESREAFCEDAGDVLSELEVEPERDVLRPEGLEGVNGARGPPAGDASRRRARAPPQRVCGTGDNEPRV